MPVDCVNKISGTPPIYISGSISSNCLETAMPPLQGEAGPSTLRRKRNTVDFPSSSASSSGDSDADSTPTPRKARLSNGHLGRSTETRTGAVSTSSGTGFNGDSDASPSRGKKRKLNGNGNGLAGVPVGGHEMDKQRRARAEKLFEQRQELPFYQGRLAMTLQICATSLAPPVELQRNPAELFRT